MNPLDETDPLIDTVDALRRFDSEDVPEDAADLEIFRRVRNLLLTVAAIGELHNRDEDPSPPAVAAERSAISYRDELAGVGFAVKRDHIREVADGLRGRGDEVRAETVERAWKWMVLMVMIIEGLS